MPFDPISTGAVRGAFSGVKSAWSYAKKRYWPPKIGYQLAPSNVLEVIRPYANRDKVIELLGHPHHKYGRGEHQVASYRFANALLQIVYEHDAIESVTLAALTMRWPNRFQVHPLSLTLGGSTMRDAADADDIELRHDNSSKFTTYWTRQNYGFPGSYHTFCFGLIEAATIPKLAWNREVRTPATIEGRRYMTGASKVKFNVVAICRDETDVFPFSWESFQ